MRTRIGTRVIAGVALVTAATIGSMAYVILRSQRAQLVAELTRSANQLSETIKSSTHYDMLENRRDSLHRQIQTMGSRDGIERIRLFNKEGQIMFSSDPAEIGRSLDMSAEGRARVYRAADGHRVLGIINPIQNERACSEASCHAHPAGASILGVLDVNVSLRDADREILASQKRMVVLVVLTIAALSALLFWLNRRLVIRPTRALLEGTKRVAAGDLTTAIPVTATHELADLARAFNSMASKLALAQQQVAQADKLASVGRLAAGVAHEINNPMTGVLTYASFLAKRAADPELKQDLEVIVRETKRCREIVKGLLDFARQAPPLRKPTDLNVVVRRAASVLMNQLSLHHVTLTLDLAEDLPEISADANQLQQVVLNLVLNAADATGESGGALRIRTRQVPDALELTVEDDGCGIKPEDLPHLFEPFFSTKGTRGTGLGLAVTWGIVRGHDGTIDVRSEVGKGSTFQVRLPLEHAAAMVTA